MSTKIVIVAGQQFSVPRETDNEAIRAQLLGMGFADVQNATVKEGTQGETPTVEFVKKAGTKGLCPASLAERLATVPPVRTRMTLAARIDAMLAGTVTFAEALDADLVALIEDYLRDAPKGSSIWANALADLPAVATTGRRAW